MGFIGRASSAGQGDSLRRCTNVYLSLPTGWGKHTYTHENSNIPIGENDCEVGYWVGKPYWNKGICTEALKLMLDYCIQVKHLENIWADHFTGNPASGRVMEKCGFSDTGMLNHCSQLVGGDKDMVKVFKYKG